jgi:hypothetical protein
MIPSLTFVGFIALLKFIHYLLYLAVLGGNAKLRI